MKSAEFRYHRPTTLEQALRLKSEHEDSKLLAGGQSLLPIMNMRLAEPEHLIDINGIAQLRNSREDEASVHYGAATTHMMIEDGLVPDPTHGLLPYVATGIGYRAIRNRGTIAGSLAHSDPSAEWPTVLSALDAVVHIVSGEKQRELPLREFHLGFFTTRLEEDELIVEVEVPSFRSNVQWGVYKMARKPGEFADSLAVALLRQDRLELWLGAALDVPVRLSGTEEGIALSATPPALEDLVQYVGADIGKGGYELQMHSVAVLRAIHAAIEGNNNV